MDWLKCFVAVVDAGSLSAAAPQVHRSQSAVSMQLKKLEAALECQLLLRGPRQHQLTPEGQTLLGYARRMLDLHAETQAAFHGKELTGRIRLGVPDDYAATYLTPALKRFAPYHGKVEIELNCEQSTSLFLVLSVEIWIWHWFPGTPEGRLSVLRAHGMGWLPAI
ncbi:LysR family transcriptional regulator [Oceanimonas sp. NS1]|nr:LysR family transcriptional regulator [Oceanimonas sp. NS1]